ncbi:hypothetical protein ACFQ0B_17485 [Nonomuraea thailandensis]
MTSPPDLARIAASVDELVRAGDTRRLRAVQRQLKSAVDRKRLAERARKYARDPVGWVRRRLKQIVWSKQREVLESVRDNRRTAVQSGHGVGKSHTASLAASWWLDTHPPGQAFVVTTAPTYAQVRAILWRYIRRIHKAAGLPGRVNQTEWWLDDEIVAFGRKPSDHDESAFQGIHARYVLVILDEACGVPAQLWVAADALTTNEDCRMLAIGNPDNPASEFRKVCRPGSGWHVIKISAYDSPNLTGEPIPREVAKALVGKEWVEEKRREWGEDNPLYKAKVEGSSPRTPSGRSSGAATWRRAGSAGTSRARPSSCCRSSWASTSAAARTRRSSVSGAAWWPAGSGVSTPTGRRRSRR